MNSLINYREEGNYLYISLNAEGMEEIDDIISNQHNFNNKWCDLTEYERCNGCFEFVLPEHIGALTDAPIIAFNIYYDDEGDLQETNETKYYWFADYQILDEFEILKSGEEVKFIKV